MSARTSAPAARTGPLRDREGIANERGSMGPQMQASVGAVPRVYKREP
jgi:hypothetical protein